MIPDSVKLSDDKKSIIITYAEGKYLILSAVKLRALSPLLKIKKI